MAVLTLSIHSTYPKYINDINKKKMSSKIRYGFSKKCLCVYDIKENICFIHQQLKNIWQIPTTTMIIISFITPLDFITPYFKQKTIKSPHSITALNKYFLNLYRNISGPFGKCSKAAFFKWRQRELVLGSGHFHVGNSK